MNLRKQALIPIMQGLSIDQYLIFENESLEKHDYYQGNVFSRHPTKITHNQITGNTISAFHKLLKDKNCSIFDSNQRIYVEKNHFFVYPDISVYLGDAVTLNNDELNATNPSIIVEVLSSGTRDYDMGLKFKLYKDIDSLKEYILIDSEKVNVQIFSINPGGLWDLREYKDGAEMMLIQTIQLEMPVKRLYRDTKLQ